jgi:CRP-like cAMP-binding protein
MAPVISPTTAATKSEHDFEPGEFLATIAKGRRIVSASNKQGIFAQGGECDAVFYIQEGKVKLTVASKSEREPIVTLLSAGDFLGEDCLAGQPLRLMSAATVEECLLVRMSLVSFHCLRIDDGPVLAAKYNALLNRERAVAHAHPDWLKPYAKLLLEHAAEHIQHPYPPIRALSPCHSLHSSREL